MLNNHATSYYCSLPFWINVVVTRMLLVDRLLSMHALQMQVMLLPGDFLLNVKYFQGM